MSLSKKFLSLSKALKDARHIRIVSHRNPDGDAICSMIVFAEICQHLNVTYDLLLQDPIPNNLQKISNPYPFQIVNSLDDYQLNNEKTDIVACLDCGNFSRIGMFANDILEHQQIINIDHHISNPFYGMINIVEDISSTTELLFLICKELKIPISKQIATAIYVGMVTDTGQFQYDKVTAQTLSFASELISLGVQPYELYEQIYQQNPIAWFKFLKLALNNIEHSYQDQLAVISFTLEELGSGEDDSFDNTHVLFPLLLSTKEIKVAVIIKEKADGTITASFRSKSDYNVEEVAKNLGGGGHRYAAACRQKNLNLDEFKAQIYQEISYLFK